LHSDPNCVFCKIVAGAIPALRVFEDADVLAFLDVGPLSEGHALAIPKEHFPTLEDMPADRFALVASRLPRIADAVRRAVGAQGCNLLLNVGREAGQEVPHLHWHIIPRVAGDKLGYRWNASTYPPGRGEEVRQAVKDALEA